MKIIKSKCQKLIISLFIVITLFNVVFPTYAHADFGGTLFKPIAQLICGIGDAILNLLQDKMLPGSPKAVEERRVADLIVEELTSSGNLWDWVQGAGLAVEGGVAKIPLLNEAYKWRKVINATPLGLSPFAMVKRTLKSFIKEGALGVINPMNFLGINEAMDTKAQYENLYQKPIFSTIILYSPYAIFSNSVPALDINFINPHVGFKAGILKYSLANAKWDWLFGVTTKDEDGSEVTWNFLTGMSNKSEEDSNKDLAEIDVKWTEDKEKDPMASNVAKQLQPTIATWYVALRNIAIVAMLSVLIYVAIRIILSSTAGETAKYKTLLKDWIVGMCLIFTLHYIMAFMLGTVETINDLFSSAMSDYQIMAEEMSEDGVKIPGMTIDPFMTISRLQAVGAVDDENKDDTNIETEFSYTLIYIVLIFYTLIFTWRYVKRFVYVAFLTMISPLVAFSYPIDKMKDGSAQAFNMWIKEYTYNVFIQPVHLLLYVILLGSAIDLATDNLIYTLVATGFLLEAEKIFKTLFGFNKATGGSMTSSVTGGVLFGAAANITNKAFGKLPGNDEKKKAGESAENDKNKIHMARKPDDEYKKLSLGSTFGSGSAGSEPAENNSEENEPAENRLAENNSAENNLAENNSAENEPAENRLAENNSAENNLAENNSAENEPTENNSAENKPAENKPAENNSANINFAENNSAEIRPEEEAPTEIRQAEDDSAEIETGRNSSMRMPIELGTGLAKGRYGNSMTRDIGQKVSKKYDNSKFGKSEKGKNAKAIAKGIKRASGSLGRRAFTRVVNKENAGKLIKGGVTAAGAAIGGTIGLAAGMASDNPGDILKYASVGAGAGAFAGKSAAGTAGAGLKGGIKEAKTFRDEYEKGRYTKEQAQARANARADKEWRESAATKNHYKDKYGDDWEDAMANAEELRKRGIVDQNELDLAQKVMSKRKDMTLDQTATLMKHQRGLTLEDMKKNWKSLSENVKNQVGDEDKAIRIMDIMKENLEE